MRDRFLAMLGGADRPVGTPGVPVDTHHWYCWAETVAPPGSVEEVLWSK